MIPGSARWGAGCFLHQQEYGASRVFFYAVLRSVRGYTEAVATLSEALIQHS